MRLETIGILAAMTIGGFAGYAVAATDGCEACGHVMMADGTTQPSTEPAAPVNKFCPIEKDNAVDPKITIVQDGKVIGFCCPECIGEFKKDPAKYMATMK